MISTYSDLHKLPNERIIDITKMLRAGFNIAIAIRATVNRLFGFSPFANAISRPTFTVCVLSFRTKKKSEMLMDGFGTEFESFSEINTKKKSI